MGMKYLVSARNYSEPSYSKVKCTNWFIIALPYFIIWSIKYEGADLQKRS